MIMDKKSNSIEHWKYDSANAALLECRGADEQHKGGAQTQMKTLTSINCTQEHFEY